jgi:hypothetical protein
VSGPALYQTHGAGDSTKLSAGAWGSKRRPFEEGVASPAGRGNSCFRLPAVICQLGRARRGRDKAAIVGWAQPGKGSAYQKRIELYSVVTGGTGQVLSRSLPVSASSS